MNSSASENLVSFAGGLSTKRVSGVIVSSGAARATSRRRRGESGCFAASSGIDSGRRKIRTVNRIDPCRARGDEHDPPAEHRNEPGGDLSDGGVAERIADEGGHHRTDAIALGRGLGEERDHVGHDAADAEPGQEPEQRDLIERGRERHQERRQAVGQHAQERAELAAEPVADDAER